MTYKRAWDWAGDFVMVWNAKVISELCRNLLALGEQRATCWLPEYSEVNSSALVVSLGNGVFPSESWTSSPTVLIGEYYVWLEEGLLT